MKYRETYGINTFIPPCLQLKAEKDDLAQDKLRYARQWTVKQTSTSRMVTKVRWVIEVVNGKFEKLKGIVNVRNTMLPHIFDDYRIAAAMINFTHKPLCADGKNAAKISSKLKKKATQIDQRNKLDILIKLGLGKKDFPAFELDSIADFPKLKKKYIERNINYGTFFTKQARMYLQDLFKNKTIYLLKSGVKLNTVNKTEGKALRSSLKKTKIIGAEFTSRHMRGKEPMIYKALVQYIPATHNVKYQYSSTKLIRGTFSYFKKLQILKIKFYSNKLGTICTCIIGKRIVGPCVHVTTLIYYLGYARYLDIFPPARHLDNLLVDPHSCLKERKPIKVSRQSEPIMESSSNSDTDSHSDTESLSNYPTIENSKQFKRKKKSKKIDEKPNKKIDIIIEEKQNKKIDNIIERTHNKKIDESIPNLKLRPVKLSLNEQELRNDRWLTDIEIAEFLRKLKEFNNRENILVNGLNDPIYIESLKIRDNYKRKDSFVEVMFSRGNHWVCVESGILNKEKGKGIITIFDSMSRTSIDNMLGTNCSLIVPKNFVEDNQLIFRVAKTQNQKNTFCGYFALAYTMAICLDIDPEGIYFDEEDIRDHFINVMLKNEEFSMFPYTLKQKTYKKKANYLKFSLENVIFN